MKQTIPYIAPLVPHPQSSLRIDLLDEAKELYDSERYTEGLLRFLDGLKDDLRGKYANPRGTSFSIPHDSWVIDIEFVEEEFRLKVDFLRLPQDSGKRLAILRQAGEMNLRRLMLARFVKHNDRLLIEYHCPISQTHPHKLYALIQNVCYVASRYGDELISKFNAERFTTPQITPYTPEQIQSIYAALQETGRYAIDTARELSQERNHIGAWLLMSTVFFQFVYYADPKGMLLLDIDKALTDLDDKLPTSEQVVRAIRALEELMSRTPEQLARGLYSTHTLISMRSRASLQDVQESLEKGYEEATQSIQSENYEQVICRLLHIIYRLYTHSHVPQKVDEMLSSALEKASGRPIAQACVILYSSIESIMNGTLGDPLDADEDQHRSIGSRILDFIKSLFN